MLLVLCSPLPPSWGRVNGSRVSAESDPHRSTRTRSLQHLLVVFHNLFSPFQSHFKLPKISIKFRWTLALRAIDSKYGESNDTSENSVFLLLHQNDPFTVIFSKIWFKSPSELTFFWNLGKFEIPLSQPKWPMEFEQNCTFSTGQYRKKGACLDFLFTQFVI